MNKINFTRIISLVLLLTLLVSCNNGYENTDYSEKSNQSDCQIQFMQMGQNQMIAEGTNAFYHISGKFLYSISKKEKSTNREKEQIKKPRVTLEELKKNVEVDYKKQKEKTHKKEKKKSGGRSR